MARPSAAGWAHSGIKKEKETKRESTRAARARERESERERERERDRGAGFGSKGTSIRSEAKRLEIQGP